MGLIDCQNCGGVADSESGCPLCGRVPNKLPSVEWKQLNAPEPKHIFIQPRPGSAYEYLCRCGWGVPRSIIRSMPQSELRLLMYEHLAGINTDSARPRIKPAPRRHERLVAIPGDVWGGCRCGFLISEKFARQYSAQSAYATLEAHLAGGNVTGFPPEGNYGCSDCGFLFPLNGTDAGRCQKCKSLEIQLRVVVNPNEKVKFIPGLDGYDEASNISPEVYDALAKRIADKVYSPPMISADAAKVLPDVYGKGISDQVEMVKRIINMPNPLMSNLGQFIGGPDPEKFIGLQAYIQGVGDPTKFGSNLNTPTAALWRAPCVICGADVDSWMRRFKQGLPCPEAGSDFFSELCCDGLPIMSPRRVMSDLVDSEGA